MNVIPIIAIVVIIFAVVNYDKISYTKFYERCEINSKHPDWYPKCAINFFEKDPQWFIDNENILTEKEKKTISRYYGNKINFKR